MQFWVDRACYRDKPAPLVRVTEALEEKYPWRQGVGWAIRIPFTLRVLVLGRWTGEQPRENVDGIPSLTFRALEHPEDYFHVDQEPAPLDF